MLVNIIIQHGDCIKIHIDSEGMEVRGRGSKFICLSIIPSQNTLNFSQLTVNKNIHLTSVERGYNPETPCNFFISIKYDVNWMTHPPQL